MRVTIASGALAGVSYGIWAGLHAALGGSFGAALVALLLALAGGLGTYLVACRLLGVRELETLLSCAVALHDMLAAAGSTRRET